MAAAPCAAVADAGASVGAAPHREGGVMRHTTIRPGLTATATQTMQAVEAACARIAPAWPLDRLIAVNPWWGYVGEPIADASAELAALGGARLTMPRAWFRARYSTGGFADRHLAKAIAQLGAPMSVDRVRQLLAEDAPEFPTWRLMTDVVDETRDAVRQGTWREFVAEHVSHVCGAWFGEGQARWPAERDGGLYGLWRGMAAQDAGVRLRMGLRGFREAAAQLPEDPRALLVDGLEELGVPTALRTAYCTALLLSVSGWAAACAFQEWEARLAGRTDDHLIHLLAARLAWELLLFRLAASPALASRWESARQEWPRLAAPIRDAQAVDWVLQQALEVAYQEQSVALLAGGRTASDVTPAAQAVFCIDVRSEVMRRALEGAMPDVATLGFAGFFGLPIAYATDSAERPQLPGLLAATLRVEDAGDGADEAARARRENAALARAWKSFTGAAASAFTAVEATGLGAAVSLVRESLGARAAGFDPLRDTLASATSPLAPRLADTARDGSPVDLAARTKLAAGILRAMSLTHGFARLVALVGHGATTCNNPQAAGLACGACGGQSGEVNARVLAALLNDGAVREALVTQGITVPATTWFVAGLHDTVTDDVTLYDTAAVPASHAADLARFREALVVAGATARRERAPRLGLGAIAHDDARLLATLRRRATDWSEVRPEWALARNAAFVIAPRTRTRGVSLDGRAFLHEYRWQEDAGFGVLELILTAPMVVTNWINLQYHASTVDPVRFGSGDKVLHNVAGGNVGVFEGAGGDLRIGLALQSVHDGTDWVHEPLRLSVFVEAPATAIDGILAKHAVVRQLVEHGWLHLFRIDPVDHHVYRRLATSWVPEGNRAR
ncbi:MAG: DUF2309 domain-containing protein [Gemmatimonadaceae bacterium]|nr:DUF2309 domain-containing protein [Gemmatimonadaceae bacterium]